MGEPGPSWPPRFRHLCVLFDLIAFFLLKCCIFEFGTITDFFRVYVRFVSPCSKYGFVVFYREFTKLVIVVSFFCTGNHCRRYSGAQGRCTPPPPPNDCLCSLFRFTQNAFLEHHVTTRQHAIMEKGTIIFKHNSRMKFSPLFAKLLATSCFT